MPLPLTQQTGISSPVYTLRRPRPTARCGVCRSHDVLVSGTASGDLHFWDASTGALIFGRAARHPNDAGMSAMGSSEGTNAGGGSDPNSVENLLGVAATTGTASVDNVNLLLYTACEEGFVKMWKVGEMCDPLACMLVG